MPHAAARERKYLLGAYLAGLAERFCETTDTPVGIARSILFDELYEWALPISQQAKSHRSEKKLDAFRKRMKLWREAGKALDANDELAGPYKLGRAGQSYFAPLMDPAPVQLDLSDEASFRKALSLVLPTSPKVTVGLDLREYIRMLVR